MEIGLPKYVTIALLIRNLKTESKNLTLCNKHTRAHIIRKSRLTENQHCAPNIAKKSYRKYLIQYNLLQLLHTYR